MNGRDLFPKVIPQLDGVRGMAILLVLLCHAEGYRLISLHRWGQKGWMGVDLFFVLSGFLITGILADAKDKPHFFRNFYGRRALRIWPVYSAVILGTYLLLRYQVLPESVRAFSWFPYAVLVQNFSTAAGFHALGPTWSLAIEEHFYLFWPLLVKRLRSLSLVHVLILIVVISPVARYAGLALGLNQFQLYKLTLLRLDGLAMGGLIALWLRAPSFTIERLRKASWLALMIGVPLSIMLVPPDAIQETPNVITMTLISLMCAGILGLALVASQTGGIGGKLLALAPLRYLGKISYSLYLIHIPLLDLLTMTKMRDWVVRLGPVWYRENMFLVFMLGSLLLATLSWYGFEQPILRWKRYFADEEIPAPAGAATASV